MGRTHPLAVLLLNTAVAAIAVLALTSPLVSAQTDGGNRPFVGAWKLNLEKSHMRAPPIGFAVYRQYEARGQGWMFHTVITITPRRTDFLFAAVRYDGRHYPVYNSDSLGNFVKDEAKPPRTVTFTRVNAHQILWTDRVEGRVVAGGICIVSPDGNTLTITNQRPGRKQITKQVYNRLSAPSAVALASGSAHRPPVRRMK